MSFFGDLLSNIFRLVLYVLGVVIVIFWIVALAAPWYSTAQTYDDPNSSKTCVQVIAYNWFLTKLDSCGECDETLGCAGFVFEGTRTCTWDARKQLGESCDNTDAVFYAAFSLTLIGFFVFLGSYVTFALPMVNKKPLTFGLGVFAALLLLIALLAFSLGLVPATNRDEEANMADGDVKCSVSKGGPCVAFSGRTELTTDDNDPNNPGVIFDVVWGPAGGWYFCLFSLLGNIVWVVLFCLCINDDDDEKADKDKV
eukprot:TRINITY_DN3615_c0_g1_i2.p1 TRINITY_DN3615_c0_g1~~TRINITY_DN3615_c0_g1_i2.p1  ORF type:complete len:263 (-),score=31.89 TRINITY_DN3615_c0_g1_i2:11-775(-)